MKSVSPFITACIAGGLSAVTSFFLIAGAQDEPDIAASRHYETAIFAGGCFWCVEADFDQVDGVVDTVSGYTGGVSDRPTYRSHSREGHLEAVRVLYDPEAVDYTHLVEVFMRSIDPTDDTGQFCDRGPSYTTAVTWTASNKIATATFGSEQLTYGYDGSNRRAIQTSSVNNETTYYVAPGYEITVNTSNGIAQTNHQHSLIVGNDVVATFVKKYEGTTHKRDQAAYYHRDLIGSGDLVTSSDMGTISQRFYTPYGESVLPYLITPVGGQSYTYVDENSCLLPWGDLAITLTLTLTLRWTLSALAERCPM